MMKREEGSGEQTGGQKMEDGEEGRIEKRLEREEDREGKVRGRMR